MDERQKSRAEHRSNGSTTTQGKNVMNLTRRNIMQALPALPGTFLLPQAAGAQTATRPIRWLVGFPAGSGTDVSVRIIAEVASRILGQPLVVENRPGASGTLAAAAMKSFPADGHTIYSMEMGAYSLVPHFLPGLAYDSVRDFRMVSLLVLIPMVLMVPTSLNVSTVGEFVNLLKSRGPNHCKALLMKRASNKGSRCPRSLSPSHARAQSANAVAGKQVHFIAGAPG
jgi:tripartite-type tricarboxylate transporter receptor subunit TctC